VGVSHVHRTLLVGRELARRGHEVVVTARPRHREAVERAGIGFAAGVDVDVPPNADLYAAWTARDIDTATRAFTDLVRGWRPDAVLVDQHPVAAMAAESQGVPSVALVTAGLTSEAVRLTGARGRTLWAARRALALRGARDLRRFTAACHRLGIRPRRTYAALMAGTFTAATELASLVGPLGPAVEVTGPLLWQDAGPTPPPPRAGSARVYVTLGNTGDPRLLDLAIRAFAGRPGYDVVVTSGHLHPPPRDVDGVFAARTVPGTDVLADARLVIHPGGAGTTYQALAAGVPMVVVPSVSGQEAIARCVQRRGVGLGLRLDGLGSERLLQVGSRVILDAGMRRRARDFADELSGVDGAAAAADRVERCRGRVR
jgi:UDP:flavonoid glycosyltransferase YjiC (YdhE family)